MIGVPAIAPKPPGFVIVNVPPWTSSGRSFFVRARSARSAIARAIPSRFFSSALRMTGHDQALAVVERDGDAEVDEALGDDLVAADLGVHARPRLQRVDDGAGDEREVGEAHAVLLARTPAFSRSRIATTFDMSISKTVVTCAEVCTERTMCSAIALRITVIGSRSARPGSAAAGRRRGAPGALERRGCGAGGAAGGGAGRRGRGGGAAGLGRAAGSAGAIAACRRRSAGAAARLEEARMSLFVTRPPRPVPGTLRRRRPVLGGDPGDDRRDEGAPSPRPSAVLVAVRSRSAGRREASDGAAGSGAAAAAARGRRRRMSRPPRGGCERAPATGAGGASGGAARVRLRPEGSSRSPCRRRTVSPSWTRISPEDAVGRARNLGVDLVGRDLEQRLVGGDRGRPPP